jgi:hypothetical protein
METEITTWPYSGKEGSYKFANLKWRAEAQGRRCDHNGKPLPSVERITISLLDGDYRNPNNPRASGFLPFIVHMSIEEAEELQAQLAKAIAERRRADSETKGKGSDKSS